VAFVNGTETANTTRSLGITTAAFEAEACQLGALVSGICPAQDRLNHNPIHNITILSTNLVAIQAITNIRPHGPIPCSRVLLYSDADSNLLHFQANGNTIKLVLSPAQPKAKPQLQVLKRGTEIAQSNVANPFPPIPGHHELHTLA
jgi:hypothetical protein